MTLKTVVTFSELKIAMSAGWELHAEMGRNPDGTRSASRNDYVLVRNGVRRSVFQRMAIKAVRAAKVEYYGTLMDNGTMKLRWKQ